MKDVALIADLVRAGVDADLVGRVVGEITASMSGKRPENVRTGYLEFERERKREAREAAKNADKLGEKQTMLASTDTKKRPEKLPDNPKVRPSLTSLLSSLPASEDQATKQGRKEEVVARRRGEPLPADWALPQVERAMAIELGMSGQEIGEFEIEFRDYWIAIPGARGRKCDWPATVRNRLREVAKRRRNTNGNRPHQGNNGRKGADFFAGLAEVAADITRDGRMAGPADPEIPLGRVNIDG